jgi:hypothetical protein
MCFAFRDLFNGDGEDRHLAVDNARAVDALDNLVDLFGGDQPRKSPS